MMSLTLKVSNSKRPRVWPVPSIPSHEGEVAVCSNVGWKLDGVLPSPVLGREGNRVRIPFGTLEQRGGFGFANRQRRRASSGWRRGLRVRESSAGQAGAHGRQKCPSSSLHCRRPFLGIECRETGPIIRRRSSSRCVLGRIGGDRHGHDARKGANLGEGTFMLHRSTYPQQVDPPPPSS